MPIVHPEPEPQPSIKPIIGWLAWTLFGAVVFAQIAEIGIQVHLGVFQPQKHFAFFTTWSSILSALCAVWIVKRPKMARWQLRLIGNLAVSEIIVCATYWTLVNTPGYWFVSSELLLHAAVPGMTVLLFLLFSWQHRELFTAWLMAIWIIVPVMYAVFVVVVGITSGWYPYDFLNAVKYGWGHAGLMMFLLLIGAGAVSLILGALVALRPRIRDIPS